MDEAKVSMDNSVEDKRAEAQAALAGAEWTAKHERELKLKGLEGEASGLEASLATNTKEREALELRWIELDNQRREIRTVLNPLLDEEKKIETEEANLEAEEAKIGLAADKHKVEEKRWAVQNQRQEVEKKKWAQEEKLQKIEALIQEHTAKYRALLDEEEKINQRLQAIKLEESSLNQ